MSLGADRMRQVVEPRVPEGYVLRGYRPGDEDGWSELLVLAGFTEWNRARVDEKLRAEGRREGSRVVSLGERIAASTFASRRDAPVPAGELDFVASHPDHRNRGLGRAVCASVVRFFSERGYDSVVLFTDDDRLPAISLYLSLGFVPQMTRDDMASRWEAVTEKLTEATAQPGKRYRTHRS